MNKVDIFFSILVFIGTQTIGAMEVAGRSDKNAMSTMSPDLVRDAAFMYTCMNDVFTRSRGSFIAFNEGGAQNTYMELIEDVPALYASISQDALTKNLYKFIVFRRYLLNEDLSELKAAMNKKLKKGDAVFAQGVLEVHAAAIKKELQKALDVYRAYHQWYHDHNKQEKSPSDLIDILTANRSNLHTGLQEGNIEKILAMSYQPRQLDLLIHAFEGRELKSVTQQKRIRNDAFINTCLYGSFTSSKKSYISFKAPGAVEPYMKYVGCIPKLYKHICEAAARETTWCPLVKFSRYLANTDVADVVSAITKKLLKGDYFFIQTLPKGLASEDINDIKKELQKVLDTFYAYHKMCDDEERKPIPLIALMNKISDNRHNLHSSIERGDCEQIIATSKYVRQLDVLISALEGREIKLPTEQTTFPDESTFWLNLPEVSSSSSSETGLESYEIPLAFGEGETRVQSPRSRVRYPLRLDTKLKSSSSPNLLSLSLGTTTTSVSTSVSVSTSTASTMSNEPPTSPREAEKKPRIPLLKFFKSFSAGSSPQNSPKNPASPRLSPLESLRSFDTSAGSPPSASHKWLVRIPSTLDLNIKPADESSEKLLSQSPKSPRSPLASPRSPKAQSPKPGMFLSKSLSEKVEPKKKDLNKND